MARRVTSNPVEVLGEPPTSNRVTAAPVEVLALDPNAIPDPAARTTQQILEATWENHGGDLRSTQQTLDIVREEQPETERVTQIILEVLRSPERVAIEAGGCPRGIPTHFVEDCPRGEEKEFSTDESEDVSFTEAPESDDPIF